MLSSAASAAICFLYATLEAILVVMGALMTHDDMCPWSLMFGEGRSVGLEYNSDVVKP